MRSYESQKLFVFGATIWEMGALGGAFALNFWQIYFMVFYLFGVFDCRS